MRKTKMRKSKARAILREWSDEFDKDYHETYTKDLRASDYRELLSEVIDRLEALRKAL
jgi:hypothetical protein